LDLLEVISDAEKLRQMNARREKYLGERTNSLIDFLVRLRSAFHLLANIRMAETKGVSRWFKPAPKPVVVRGADKKSHGDYLGPRLIASSTKRRLA
jgi:hypothetical protein